MTNHDLYRAIGEVDDVYLLECETRPVRRVSRRFGLIAAVVALMLTACAAPAIIQTFDKIQSGDRSENGYDYVIYEYGNGSKTPSAIYYLSSDVQIEVSVSEDAPDKIETQYLPLRLFDYCQLEEYEQTDDSLILSLSTGIPQFGNVPCVQYRQYTLPEDGFVTVPNILNSMEWEKSTQIYGDVTALEYHCLSTYIENADGERMYFEGTPTPTITMKAIFWSDGDYLYCLKFPITYKLTNSVVEGIVTSLTAVEDISEYLTTAE